MLNLFSTSSLFLCFCCLILNLFILRSKISKLLLTWACFNFAVGLWGFSAFIIGFTKSHALATIWWQIAHIGIAFIPVFLFHNTLILCEIKANNILKFAYFQAVFFIFISQSPFFISGIHNFSNILYISAGPLYYIFFFLWMFLVAYSLYHLFIKYRLSEGIRKDQIRYLFLGMLLGFTGGITNFLPVFGINFYPIGNVTIPIYCFIVTYAILKYRLLDIRIVITRTGIFIAVYSLVLGIPFALAFGGQAKLNLLIGSNWWLVPMGSLTVLATAGPFIYLYIQNRAEAQLLREQRRYQSTLSQASSGMGRIKDLKRLLALIVYVVTRAVRLEHSAVYILSNNKYVIGAYKRNSDKENLSQIDNNSPLVAYLIKNRLPVVYEEIKQRVQDYNDTVLFKIEQSLKELDAALVVPSLIEDRLLAILVLGKKKSGKLYSEDDLSVFSILANQAALAIENAQFYEDIKKTQEQLFQAEKMATIGTMADGLSHQINNRFHALGFIAGDALDTVKLKKTSEMSDDMKEVMIDLERALVRIQENVVQGGEVVQGLLRYTRKGEEGFAPVEIDRLVTAALEMAQFKIKTHELKILREYDLKGPKLKGNFTQLQEVFFNMIDNAYDAMMQRKNEKKEPGYQPTLRILSEVQNDRLIIKFIDNGIGVKPEDFQKIFTPFFTTKLSSKKGTGLGLYVIKKIIDENHKGKVTFSSTYMEGTTMQLDLAMASG
jgi:signal transduction histidine kinase